MSTTTAYSEIDSSITPEKLEFHVVYSEDLRDIMQRLNQLVYKKELSELHKKELRSQHLEDLVYTVNELGFAAIILQEALPGFDLSTEEKDIFHAIAIQLQKEAEIIKEMAEQNDTVNMKRSYKRLNDTCSACHELFRF
jgi:cytochrome c'